MDSKHYAVSYTFGLEQLHKVSLHEIHIVIIFFLIFGSGENHRYVLCRADLWEKEKKASLSYSKFKLLTHIYINMVDKMGYNLTAPQTTVWIGANHLNKYVIYQCSVRLINT